MAFLIMTMWNTYQVVCNVQPPIGSHKLVIFWCQWCQIWPWTAPWKSNPCSMSTLFRWLQIIGARPLHNRQPIFFLWDWYNHLCTLCTKGDRKYFSKILLAEHESNHIICWQWCIFLFYTVMHLATDFPALLNLQQNFLTVSPRTQLRQFVSSWTLKRVYCINYMK